MTGSYEERMNKIPGEPAQTIGRPGDFSESQDWVAEWDTNATRIVDGTYIISQDFWYKFIGRNYGSLTPPFKIVGNVEGWSRMQAYHPKLGWVAAFCENAADDLRRLYLGVYSEQTEAEEREVEEKTRAAILASMERTCSECNRAATILTSSGGWRCVYCHDRITTTPDPSMPSTAEPEQPEKPRGAWDWDTWSTASWES